MNTDKQYVSIIFEEKPKRWGLRGDPYLWEEMKYAFSEVPIVISEENFIKEFMSFFKKFTGASLTCECHVFQIKYAHGGMSSGQISGEFWMKEVLPLLIERLRKSQD